MIRQALFAVFAAAIGLTAATPADARVRIDITQATVEPMPVAVPDFKGTDSQLSSLGRDVTGVIMADLDRSGLFSVIDQRAYVEKLDSVDVRPRFPDWRIINAQVLVVGEVRQTPDGRIEVATRVWDVYSNEQLGAVSFKTPADNWRRAAHKVADF
ncbi:MAG: Tol-Pal system protein TolB, partial [Pseudomonadota bacterium]